MKKLIGIFVILLFTLSILGQTYDPNALTDNAVIKSKVFVDHFEEYMAGDRSSYKNFEDDQYWFKKKGVYYIVSYDTVISKERELLLYKWDGKWEKACEMPLRTDILFQRDDGIWSQSVYHPYPMDGGGSVIEYEKNEIMLVIPYFIVPDITRPWEYRRYENIINLLPTKDGMYYICAKGNM